MAYNSKLFLNEVEQKEAEKSLKPLDFKPGKISSLKAETENTFSTWLIEKLEKKLSTLPGWKNSCPIALGSWARNELCPRSDVDILLCGKGEDISKLVDALNKSGLKVRHRVPEDINDWTKGVDPFDVLAILNAHALSEEGAVRLHVQKNRILQQSVLFRKSLSQAMKVERQDRAKRYDSISNYLEPNIKYGRGGLRDLQQALSLIEIFPTKFSTSTKVKKKLLAYKSFLLNIRQKLHLTGYSDLIHASAQKPVGEWLGYSSIKDFMKDVQLVLAEVSFYADWVFERASSSQRKISQYNTKILLTPQSAFDLLKADSSVQAQEVVRKHLVSLLGKQRNIPQKAIGSLLNKYLEIDSTDKFIVALFQSGLLSYCITELRRVRGLVQHDQYHRFTVYAHLLQSVRELQRIKKQPKLLGFLAPLAKSLTTNDWKILLWTCVYHDLAKGRSGDHSTSGAKLVRKDFTSFKFSLRLTVEVSWLVENHLILSSAAFRRNPKSPATWRFLHEKSIKGTRLDRLAVFTAVDIRATNPDAWNEWKETLIRDLVETMNSSRATKFVRMLELAAKRDIQISREFVKALDPSLVESVPTLVLINDYHKLTTTKDNLKTIVLPGAKGEYWIRFHRRKDKAGLFLSLVQLLFTAGCKIRESSVHTFNQFGVYDWFRIKSNRNLKQLRKLIEIVPLKEAHFDRVKFDTVSLVSADKEEAIISFRGRDQKGALMTAVTSLYEEGLEIKWARVHTWGRQLDDVFCVHYREDIKDRLSSIKLKYQAVDSENLN